MSPGKGGEQWELPSAVSAGHGTNDGETPGQRPASFNRSAGTRRGAVRRLPSRPTVEVGLLPFVLVPGPPWREDTTAGWRKGQTCGSGLPQSGTSSCSSSGCTTAEDRRLQPGGRQDGVGPAQTASHAGLASGLRLAATAAVRADPPALRSTRPGRCRPGQPWLAWSKYLAHRVPRLGTQHPLRGQSGPGRRPHQSRRRRPHPAHGDLFPAAGSGPARRPHRHGAGGGGDLRG